MVISFTKSALLSLTIVGLTACSGGNSINSAGSAGSASGSSAGGSGDRTSSQQRDFREPEERETIWDLFNQPDQNATVGVNKYLWRASLDVLNFLPVEAADPFSGVMVLGWGSAPGSSRQYRATVYVTDPALDARSLRVAIQTRGGTASAETQRQIENAILSRARQLRISGAKL